MSKLNEHILDTVRNKTSDDDVMHDFLFEILRAEADQTGKYWWHFKDKYKKLISRYSRSWNLIDENNQNNT